MPSLKFYSYLCKIQKNIKKMINKYIKAKYKLYDVTDGNNDLIEETKPDVPFVLISGMGVAIDEFERQLTEKNSGEEFDITLTPAQAYGEYVDARVLELDKQIFTRNGKFDHENIFEGAIVPLQNPDGEQFLGNIVKIGAEKVIVDLNHPLAGKTLNFKGTVLESHEATAEEMAEFVKLFSGEGGCGGNCEGCGGHCHGDGEGHCHNEGEGHCHHEGEGHCHHGGEGHCHHGGKGHCHHDEN